MVIVFEHDNLQGNCYILQSDNASNQPNKDFTQARIAFGKDTDNRKLSGTKDLNDMISSMLVFDPNQDYVTLFEHCDNPNYGQTENMTKVYPAPLPTQANSLDAFNCIGGNWGWNSLEKLNYFNDRTSSLFFGDGHVLRDALIYEDNNFAGQSNSVRADMRCFKNLKYSNTSKGIFSSDWNDRTSSIVVRMGTSYVEIVN